MTLPIAPSLSALYIIYGYPNVIRFVLRKFKTYFYF